MKKENSFKLLFEEAIRKLQEMEKEVKGTNARLEVSEKERRTLEKDVRGLKKTNGSLQKKVEQQSLQMREEMRFVSTVPEGVTISQHLINIGFVSAEKMRNVTHTHIVQINGRNCRVMHPDHSHFLARITALSRKMSRHIKAKGGHYPALDKAKRTNIYTNREFRACNRIIRDYLKQYPQDKWKVDWDFTPM